MTTDITTELAATVWGSLCPELVRLAKYLDLQDPAREKAGPSDNSAVLLNRWGHPAAHSLEWMENQALNRMRID